MAGPRRVAPIYRFPLLVLGIASLLLAMWAGLMRMGWALPPLGPTVAVNHGPLMVAGFLGTLISLERAVAGVALWTYASPLLVGIGGLGLALGMAPQTGAALITVGSVVLVFIYLDSFRKQLALFNIIQAVAALIWVAGNILWLIGLPIAAVVPWWAGFLVLTIAGERLELSRVLFLSRLSVAGLVVAGLLYLVGAVISAGLYGTGIKVVGLGLLALALWLMRHDIARRTVRQKGLTRFIAFCMLIGYVWLGISGITAMFVGGTTAGVGYDAWLHATFIGFVLSMIFGHAPVIFPAVLGVPIPYFRVFYVHLILLHGSLLLRIASELLGFLPGRRWGGMLNMVAILLFLFNTVRAARTGLKDQKAGRHRLDQKRG